MYSIGSDNNTFLMASDMLEHRGDDVFMPNFPGYWVGMKVHEAHTDNRYVVVDESGKLEKIDD